MSIKSVHARMTDLQIRLVPQAAQEKPTETQRTTPAALNFRSLLAGSTSGWRSAASAGAGKSVKEDGNVAGVRAYQLPRATVTSARPGVVVSSGTGPSWTGVVDTSDGMIEKAAPYMDIIRDASSIYGVPVNVIMGVIKAESDYEIRCLSYSGAMGLMQIMPENAEYFGVTDAYDPRQNIMCGTEEIARHLKTYNGDLKLALCAYNTGPGNVARRGVTSSNSEAYNTIPASIRQYADRVMQYAGLAT